jgi:ferredoxin
MSDLLASLLWVVFGVSAISAVILIFRWRRELNQSGWWTGIVVEGRRVDVGVDHDLCMGASSCVELAPEVFHLDWSKKKSMFDPAPLEASGSSGTDPQRVFKAAQSCPYRAIFLKDANTGEDIFP